MHLEVEGVRMQRKRMIENFDLAADSYDRQARVQSMAARRLVSMIPSECLVPGTAILEVGCGTGILSEMIAELAKSGTYVCNDVSSRMLTVCKRRMEKHGHMDTSYIAEDVRRLSLPGLHFNMVTSNAVFQWIGDLEALFLRLHSYCEDGGTLLFSMFIDGTLVELQSSINKAYIDAGNDPVSHLLHFRSRAEIEEVISEAGYRIDESVVEDFELQYDTPLTMMHALRDTGTAHFHAVKVPVQVMRRTVKNYTEKFSNADGSVKCTYRGLFMRVIK
jgi:malonyl-ACP O-methyltransferase BioC